MFRHLILVHLATLAVCNEMLLGVPNFEYENPYSQQVAPCQNNELLLNILNNILAVFSQTNYNIDNENLQKINNGLDTIEKYLKILPLTMQGGEAYSKLKEVEANLLKLKEKTRKNVNYAPNQNVQSKLVMQYNLPASSNPDCRKAFLKLIDVAQNAYMQLMNHPMCKGGSNDDKQFVISDGHGTILPVGDPSSYPIDFNALLNPGAITMPNNMIFNPTVLDYNYISNQNLNANTPIPSSDNGNIMQKLLPNIQLPDQNSYISLSPYDILNGPVTTPKTVNVELVTPLPVIHIAGSLPSVNNAPDQLLTNNYNNVANSEITTVPQPSYVENLMMLPEKLPSENNDNILISNYATNQNNGPPSNFILQPNHLLNNQPNPSQNVESLKIVTLNKYFNQLGTNTLPVNLNNNPSGSNMVPQGYPLYISKLPDNQLSYYNSEKPNINGLQPVGLAVTQQEYFQQNKLPTQRPEQIFINSQNYQAQQKDFSQGINGINLPNNMGDRQKLVPYLSNNDIIYPINYYPPNFSPDFSKGNVNNIKPVAKFDPHQLSGATNSYKLNSVSDKNGIIELTYLLKRPTPMVYQPYYVVKYRLPYTSFLQQMKNTLATSPQLRSDLTSLFKEIINQPNVFGILTDFRRNNEKNMSNLAPNESTLTKADVVDNKNNFVQEQMDILKKLNSDANLQDVLNLIDKHIASVYKAISDRVASQSINNPTKSVEADNLLFNDIVSKNLNLTNFTDLVKNIQALPMLQGNEIKNTPEETTEKTIILKNGREVYKQLPNIKSQLDTQQNLLPLYALRPQSGTTAQPLSKQTIFQEKVSRGGPRPQQYPEIPSNLDNQISQDNQLNQQKYFPVISNTQPSNPYIWQTNSPNEQAYRPMFNSNGKQMGDQQNLPNTPYLPKTYQPVISNDLSNQGKVQTATAPEIGNIPMSLPHLVNYEHQGLVKSNVQP